MFNFQSEEMLISPHVAEIIFEKLDGVSLLKCAFVCKKWREISEQEHYWLEILKDLQEAPGGSPKLTTKQFCLLLLKISHKGNEEPHSFRRSIDFHKRPKRIKKKTPMNFKIISVGFAILSVLGYYFYALKKQQI